MSFEITGKIIEKYDSVQVTERFRKREFVIEIRKDVGGNEFIDTPKFQLTQDRCELLDSVQIGEEIKLQFNIRGRRWEKDGQVNYFNNLEAWKIEKMSAPVSQAPPHTLEDIPPEPSDDLPF
ncbi:MAG: hypothetical protein B6I19_07370 [Bacteroidetes bacterium 4572_114]|nr:MAG: hypothetical protein B6I19_07370 [Bacteroidetes bacterium 4572_114]